MEVGTTENSSAITNTRKMEVGTTENSSAVTNNKYICNNKYKRKWRLEQLRIHLQ